jgi:D-alanyl-D-alanine carboxypeptidase
MPIPAFLRSSALVLPVVALSLALSGKSPPPAAATRAPAPDRRAGLDVAAMRAALAAAVTKADGFSGVVLVARGDDVLFEAAVGKADRQRGLANTPDTSFNLASTEKMFTTVAVLQLVEQGKLDLDAPVGRYLPDWPEPTVRDQATVRHLLTHGAGLGSHFYSPLYFERRTRLRSVRDYLPLVGGESPSFAPGSDYAYSNSGFLLLGRLVEVASGRDYYEYVQAEVFRRAGMRDSGYFGTDGAGGARTATGYVPTADGLVDNQAIREWRGGPAGGGYASARDLLRFRRALLDGTLLRPDTVDMLLTPVALPGEGARRSAGLGMIVSRSGDDVGFGHPGGTRGAAAEFWSLRRDGLTLVLLSNVAPVPRSGQPATAMALANALQDAIVAAGGPRLGSGARRRG